MVHQFGHGERTVQHQPVYQIRELAQSSAYSAPEFPGAYHKSVKVSALCGGFADELPERESFPGLND